jgi:GTP-binding protein
LRGVVWLLDIRHSPSAEDWAMQESLAEAETHVLAALTKADKLSTRQRETRERELREALELPEDQVVVTSAETGYGIVELKEAIGDLISGATA